MSDRPAEQDGVKGVGQLPSIHTIPIIGHPAIEERETHEGREPAQGYTAGSKGAATPRRALLCAPSPNLTPRQTAPLVEGEFVDFTTPRVPVTVGSKVTFGGLMLAVTCINSTFSLMAPIFPQEAEKRHIQPAMTGAIFSIYSFANFFVSPLHGHIMQRRYLKRKHMLALGLILSSLSSLGFALSTYIPVRHKALFCILCLVLRVVNGVGAAAVDTSSMAICTELFKDSDYFGTLLGILDSSLAVGWMLGPLVGGYLAVWGGFQAPFFAAALIGALMIPIPFLMPQNQRGSQVALQKAVPVTPWTLLANLEISLFLLVTVLSAAAVTFCDSVLAPFLQILVVQDKQGFSEGTVGVCFAVIALSYAIFTTSAGWLSDKTSPVSVMLTGLLISVVPFALLGPSPFLEPLLLRAHLSGAWHVWVSLVLLGSGCAMCLMPILPALLVVAEREDLAHSGVEDLASGMIAGAYYLGGGAGPIVGGAATALLGFEWASTAYGIGLLVLSSIVAIILLIAKRRQYLAHKAYEPLLGEDELSDE